MSSHLSVRLRLKYKVTLFPHNDFYIHIGARIMKYVCYTSTEFIAKCSRLLSNSKFALIYRELLIFSYVPSVCLCFFNFPIFGNVSWHHAASLCTILTQSKIFWSIDISLSTRAVISSLLSSLSFRSIH